ncbi:MAG: multicopper oxidase domain-containing protein, partial [Ignavibacteria bacterium]|nr:multicopper oxidase domain-containing protein [Ignavibacteria bacterium]
DVYKRQGLSVPEIMDGHPKDAIPPSGSYTYTFPVLNRAGTYFYHSHSHMLTAKQVYKGFAGFFIVTDPNENIFNLPSGNYDIPLCIQDRRIADIPNFNYNPTTYDMQYGYLGDTVLVNGTPDAYLSVSRTLYRFRLLNGSNARVYRIAFSDNRSFHIIATDGGLKDQPVTATEFKLSPGERVEILFDFSAYNIGQSVKLVSLPYTHSGTLPYKQGIALDIIRFDVVNNNSSGGVVPSAFNPINYYDINSVSHVRNFTLSMVSNHPMHRINGLTFDINRIDWEVPLERLEEWKIINTTADFHPMHSHEVQFQVYSRNGNTNLPPNDRGWKDTVLVNPGETVRTLVKFTGYKGIYLYHCHNLEHEDDGMMLNFRVIDPIGIKQISSVVPSEFKLYQNYPNPFNPVTNIRFKIPLSSEVTLKIYNSAGKELDEVFRGVLRAGEYEAKWNASRFHGGVYFAKFSSGKYVGSLKMILVK